MADPVPEGRPLNWCGQRGDHGKMGLDMDFASEVELREHFREWRGDIFREMTPIWDWIGACGDP